MARIIICQKSLTGERFVLRKVSVPFRIKDRLITTTRLEFTEEIDDAYDFSNDKGSRQQILSILPNSKIKTF